VRHFSPAAINQKLLQIMALLLPLRREWQNVRPAFPAHCATGYLYTISCCYCLCATCSAAFVLAL
jgi:hypothetical protein